MDGIAAKGKQLVSDFNGDFAARCEPAGLGCLVSEAIDGKPLTNAFNADLGGGLDFPPHAPDSARRARQRKFSKNRRRHGDRGLGARIALGAACAARTGDSKGECRDRPAERGRATADFDFSHRGRHHRCGEHREKSPLRRPLCQAPRATMRRQTSCISRQVNGVTWASTRSRHFPPTRGRGCGSPGSIRAAPPKRLACESATSFAPPTAIESIGEPTSHGSSPTPHRPAGFSSWSRQFAMAGTTRSPHGLPGPGPAATGLFREAASGHRSPSPQRHAPLFRHQWPRRAAGILAIHARPRRHLCRCVSTRSDPSAQADYARHWPGIASSHRGPGRLTAARHWQERCARAARPLK